MAGLDPAIHDFLDVSGQDVDAQDEPGHDGKNYPTSRNTASTALRSSAESAFWGAMGSPTS
jgi:hypothetical protein